MWVCVSGEQIGWSHLSPCLGTWDAGEDPQQALRKGASR